MIVDEERLSRNWDELLQELRVTQTGVQILTGFLLTLPFTPLFAELNDRQRTIYLTLFVASVLATGLIVAPVAYHRVLFRRRQRPWLVEAANVTARLGLCMLVLVSAGVILFVFDVVVSFTAAIIAATTALVVIGGLWGVAPWIASSPPQPPLSGTEQRNPPRG